MTRDAAGRDAADAGLGVRARALHARCVVVDALDVSVHDAPHWREMKAGGVTAANLTVTVSDGFADTCRLIADLNDRVAAHPDLARRVLSVSDIHAAKAGGRVGLIYGFQNASPIESDLRHVQVFRDLGVRIVQLVFNAANLVGDSCQEPRGAGLTAYGRALVAELDRRHIVVDISHCDDRTTLDAIEHSTNPVAITHANARALSGWMRNKGDDVIRALAARGGVIGIAALAHFVADDWREADLARFCDHVDYVANLVGIDHVGLGLDLTEDLPASVFAPPAWGGSVKGPDTLEPFLREGLYPFPYARGLARSSDLPAVTRELLRRGYAEDAVAKVLGGNWLRLFAAVWDD